MTRAFLVHLEVEETDDLNAISNAISFDLSDAYKVIKVEPWSSPTSGGGPSLPPPTNFPVF